MIFGVLAGAAGSIREDEPPAAAVGAEHEARHLEVATGTAGNRVASHQQAPHRIVKCPQWTHRPFDPLANGRKVLHPHFGHATPFMRMVSRLVRFGWLIFFRLKSTYI
ncbi:MAG: hypothetical protein CL536_00875 [Alcaligenaceae bacterium]|nr:hypothetical protein [Alcaligenaceae bacterium]